MEDGVDPNETNVPTEATGDVIAGSNSLHYSGSGTDLAIIMLKNILLTILTLGIYAPWARTNTRRYLWGHTTFMGDRASYTGTGKELFRGWALVFVLYIAIVIFIQVVSKINPFLVFILFPLYIYLYSIIIYSGTRYRLSRTKWREVTFGLDRSKEEARAFVFLFIKGLVISFFTFGLYYPLFIHHTRKFLTDRAHFGDLYFEYEGHADELFKLMLKNFFLSIITLGFYAPWGFCMLTSYRLKHTRLGEAKMDLHLKGSQLFVFSFCSYLAVICSFGLALPWIINWAHKLITNAIVVEGEIKVSEIHNVVSTGESYADVAAMEYHIDLGF